MGVSKNRGKNPKSSHVYRVFHYKPSILVYPYFWKHPYNSIYNDRRGPPWIYPHIHQAEQPQKESGGDKIICH